METSRWTRGPALVVCCAAIAMAQRPVRGAPSFEDDVRDICEWMVVGDDGPRRLLVGHERV